VSNPPGELPSIGKNGAALVLTLVALSAFGPLCLDMYLPALPELPAALHGTASGAQLSLTGCIIGLAVGQLVVGPLSDRLGRRTPLLVGVALFTLVSAACALVTSMPMLIGLRLLQGAAGAAGIVVGRAIVADLFTGRAAASYFSTLTAINGMSPILAPLIGGQVLRVGSWRTVFWVLAGIGVLIWIGTFRVIPETLPPDRRARHGLRGVLGSFGRVLSDGPTIGYTLAGAAVAAAMFGYISGSPFLLQDGFGLSPQQFSLCFAANALGIVMIGQLSRILLRRGAAPVTLLAAGVVQSGVGAGTLLAAVLLVGPLWLVLAAFWVMVSAVGMALPNASAVVMDRHRGVAGAMSAVFGLTQFAAAAVVTPLVGFGDRGRGTAVGLAAVCCVLIAAIAYLKGRRGDRQRAIRSAPA
jgi:DHA1 family bicyclomycin/chloramphenicol resistance-like MFS transporter